MPAIAAPLSPLSVPLAAAAEARDGLAPDDVTPLHRSPVALRVELTGVLGCFAGALAGAFALLGAGAEVLERVGAVELANTDWPP